MSGLSPCVPAFRAFVGLGANLGDAAQALASATRALDTLPSTRVEAASSLYRTRPVDAQGPDFINAVVALRSALGPLELLSGLQGIESAFDRQRPYRNAPRTLDLDLLWFGGAVRQRPMLTLPHPRMAGRAFVLTPLAEVLAALAQADAGRARGLPMSAALGDPVPALPSGPEQARLAAEQGIEKLGPMAWKT